MNQNTTIQTAFLDTNIFMSIARETIAAQKEWNSTDAALIAETLTCSEPCDCCQSTGPTYKDPETRCAYCLTCLEASTEPMDDSGEVDEEIVEIGMSILAEQAANRAKE